MNKLSFNDDLAIREVLDDIISMVDRREKLIGSVSEQVDESGDSRMKEHLAKLEGLMTDFLLLFEPVLTKVRAYGETIKSSISDSQAFLKSLVGIIDAGKSIDGTSATLQELEKDADQVEEELRESTEILEKIEDLFKRTKQYERESPASNKEDIASHEPYSRQRWVTKSDTLSDSRGHVIARPRSSSYEPSKSQH